MGRGGENSEVHHERYVYMAEFQVNICWVNQAEQNIVSEWFDLEPASSH